MKRIIVGLLAGACLAGQGSQAEWYEDIKIKGDFRYRFEYIDEEGKDERQRDMIRARIGAFSQLNPDMDMGIQLSTDSEKGNKSDPVGGNATLTDVFSKKSIFLNLAYFSWHPEALSGLEMTAGKMNTPFFTVGDYLWDSDVTPEGLAARYEVGSQLKATASAGYMWLVERATADDSRLYAAQLALKFKASEKAYVMGGCSYYYFDKVKGENAVDFNWQSTASGFGNTLDKIVTSSGTNSVYAHDYRPLEPFVEAGFDVGLPVRIFGSYVVNPEADEDKTGFMTGITLGKIKEPGSFELGYNFRRLEKDAWLGALADSNSWGGGTDGQGHQLTAKYQLVKNLQAAASYYIDDKKMDDSIPYHRLQVDLMAKF